MVLVNCVAVPTQTVVVVKVGLGLANVAVVPPKFNVKPDDEEAVYRSIKME